VLVEPYVKVSENFINIMSLIHVQCSLLAVTDYLNAENVLCLPQILDFESLDKHILESKHVEQCG